MDKQMRAMRLGMAVLGFLATAGRVAAEPARGTNRDMHLQGGAAGTAFESLTIEGEDRVRLQFERPALELDLDAARAPGLEWGSALDVLERTPLDLATPLLAGTTTLAAPYLARPWLQQFASGAVARFQPQVDNVERWKLEIADSRGTPVAAFEGRGTPPRDIAWNGRTTTGVPVTPGLTYSYVLHAVDRAGNKRSFVGPGFEVANYRLDGPRGSTLAFSAAGLGGRGKGTTAPLLLEAASWINQAPSATRLRVRSTARSLEQANALAALVAGELGPHVLGDPARLQVATLVERDAPEAGTVEIAPAE